jgi:hypothetical protein
MDMLQKQEYAAGVPQLPRFHAYDERIEDERKLARILLETGEAASKTSAGATGDHLRNSRLMRASLEFVLREIPPLHEAVDREHDGFQNAAQIAIRTGRRANSVFFTCAASRIRCTPLRS